MKLTFEDEVKLLHQSFALLRTFFRKQRYKKIVDDLQAESVGGFILDLGGGPASFFASQFPKPEKVVLVEIGKKEARIAKENFPALHVVIADGEQLPFADATFELTVCNSVIEHVQHPALLAQEIRRTSQNYFVQTPNGEFPIEPHSFIGIPFYRNLPPVLRQLACRFMRGNYEYIESVTYVKEEKLRRFFPEATMYYEHVLGMVKSFYITHRKTARTP